MHAMLGCSYDQARATIAGVANAPLLDPAGRGHRARDAHHAADRQRRAAELHQLRSVRPQGLQGRLAHDPAHRRRRAGVRRLPLDRVPGDPRPTAEPSTVSTPSYLDADPAVRMAALAELRHRCPVVPPAADRRAVGRGVTRSGRDRLPRDRRPSAAARGRPVSTRTTPRSPGSSNRGTGRSDGSSTPWSLSTSRSRSSRTSRTCRLGSSTSSRARSPPAVGPGVDVMPIAVDPIPPHTMARLLGFPEADAPKYYAWADRMGAAFAAAAAEGRTISMAEAVPEFTAYVEQRIAERQATPEAGLAPRRAHKVPHHRDRRRAACRHAPSACRSSS